MESMENEWNFLGNDISFCMNGECKRSDCRRHRENIPKGKGIYSASVFDDGNGVGCKWYIKK